MRVTKIKHRAQTTINWETNNDTGARITHEITSPELPRPEFIRVLGEVSVAVALLLGLDAAHWKTYGLTFDYKEKDDSRGIVFSLERGMEKGIMITNSPRYQTADLPPKLAELVESFVQESTKYCRGERAQLSLIGEETTDG